MKSLQLKWLLLYGGLFIALSAGIKGYSGIRTSIVDGARTRDWPSTPGVAYSASKSSAKLWSWPKHQMLFRPYYYEIGGTPFSSSFFDVHGPFVGSESDIQDYLRNYPSENLTVYYEPDNPKRAVLKRGISFDHMSRFYLAFFAIGAVAFGTGIFLLWKRPNAKPLPLPDSRKLDGS